MFCFDNLKLKLIATIGSLVTAVAGVAQTTETTATSTPVATQGSNMLEILLVVMMIILVFVIWGLGQVLLVLGKQVIEKNRKATKIAATLLLFVLLLNSNSVLAQDSTSTATATVSQTNYGGLSPFAFYTLVTVFAVEIIIIFFMAFFIRRFSAELLPQKVKVPAKERHFRKWWANLDKRILTKAVPVEREADVLLDHDYDGIRELDNPLPPWWKYGFYITIGVAVVYLLNFHVFGFGKNPIQEYNAEMEKAKIQMEIYNENNKNKIDENNVPMADAAGLAKAKDIFEAKCYVCHGKLGEGGVGPNLTDNYWLHGGTLNEIYQSITHGYADKGMPEWSTFYTPLEISYLASYVKTLHGTNPPNAKAPQGVLFVDSANVAPVKDSLKLKPVKQDSSK
jgi:cytochrome c oxidase cbb3-type subunit III